MNESSAIALVLLTSGAIVGTYLWRGAGVMFAARIKSDSPVFQWVTFVSYAMPVSYTHLTLPTTVIV